MTERDRMIEYYVVILLPKQLEIQGKNLRNLVVRETWEIYSKAMCFQPI